MKKLFTLAVISALAVNAQAQAPITIDGTINTAETVAGGYTLVGTYTGPHGFSPNAVTNQAGLLALYAAADANNIYFFLAGTLENDLTSGQIKNSLQILISRPGATSVPVGTILPLPRAATAPAVNTSFQKFAAKLTLPGDIGIAISGANNKSKIAKFKVGGIVYKGGAKLAARASVLNDSTAATGAVASITGQTDTLAVFNGAKVAYLSSSSLNTNPGFGTDGKTAKVPASGLEISFSRASIGLPAAGGAIQLFALQNNSDGGYASTDVIPQNSSNTENYGKFNNDFSGTKAATISVGAGTGVTVLGTKAADADALALQLYPNPATSVATLEYNVGNRADNVSIMLTDLLGRNIQSIANGLKPAGKQNAFISTASVAAGTYLVRVQVGDKVSTRKVVLL